ncbi:MAG: homoserine dehydrogenase [Spirochaetales bacterium]|nr:homoserine dehydrogenase [Spirochaetales bacterium]
MSSTKEIHIAIVGCGNIGGTLARILLSDNASIAARNGINIHCKYIVDVNFENARKLGLPENLFETDLGKVLADPDISLLVELIGGTGIARTISERILKSGKHLVTANKALLAHHGSELLSLARQNNVTLSFEASCAGGIPIIRALVDGLSANSIEAFYGIVNGTCNYILTSMVSSGRSFADALKRAQEKGLAEEDPELDISGGDSAHKLCIMSALAFGADIDISTIPVKGISDLDLNDILFGKELGYTIKLLAIAGKTAEGLSLNVQPAFLHNDHPLAWVSGPFNAVSVYGNRVGHTMYYGRGAGGSPTASALIADIISAANGSAKLVFDSLRIWPDMNKPAMIVPADKITSRFYIRSIVDDQPGVLAAISGILARHGISITSALQKEPSNESELISVVMTTHIASAGEVSSALKELASLPAIHQTICIPIIDEHEEHI